MYDSSVLINEGDHVHTNLRCAVQQPPYCLTEYSEGNGNAAIPKSYSNLARWIRDGDHEGSSLSNDDTSQGGTKLHSGRSAATFSGVQSEEC
ncbi:hypothetical protein AAFF_G00083400 [Aldrovandia affinis]|uniref:Uncharacterized protein n=1 Tax=Aldrovandia affinis TaxID=143900 RepID=A0AAD7RXK0_9TELE|nr:hypothetical protein AAFF_G00083400 [Aldrovandia affinis]